MVNRNRAAASAFGVRYACWPRDEYRMFWRFGAYDRAIASAFGLRY